MTFQQGDDRVIQKLQPVLKIIEKKSLMACDHKKSHFPDGSSLLIGVTDVFPAYLNIRELAAPVLFLCFAQCELGLHTHQIEIDQLHDSSWIH